jgi:hypothetical protein
MERFKALSWSRDLVTAQTIKAKQVVLSDILRQESVPSDFDVFSLDVEGHEWNVLKTFDLDYWKPKIAIIELHDQNKDYEFLHCECARIVEYFESGGYRVIYKDFTNTIYVRGDVYRTANPT